MKHGKTKFWLDSWASSNHVECYLRWETLVMPKGFQNIRIPGQRTPDYLLQYVAIMRDAIGFCVEFMSRRWTFYYSASLRQFCIGLWFVAFSFMLPRTPIFKRLGK